MKYLIRIKKCSSPDWWYSDKINSAQWVIESGIVGKYRLFGDEESNNCFLIDKEDCYILIERKIK